MSRLSKLLLLPMLAATAQVAQSADPVTYVSDNNSLVGDHVYLRVNVAKFIRADDAGQTRNLCAPQGTRLRVTGESGNDLLVKFVEVASKAVGNKADGSTKMVTPLSQTTSDAVRECAGREVNTFTQYKISKGDMESHAYARTGIVFGGLVVPFKFYFSDKSIEASTTVAPYVGMRLPYHFYGATLTPVASAGLGLVPIADAAGSTSTKPSLSVAVGLVIRSTKNQSFNAGLLIGRDYLSKADRLLDPKKDDIWLSLYLGTAFK